MKVYEKKPAAVWAEGFPIGNGRLGAVVYGDPFHETIQLNEESLWSGWYDGESDNPMCAEMLPKIREAIFKGDYETSEALAYQYMICRGRGSSSRYDGHFGSYQTAGELRIDLTFKDTSVTDYTRTLDLETGLVEAAYSVGGNAISERVFASFADGVLAIHYKGTAPFSAFCRLTREQSEVFVTENGEEMILSGAFPCDVEGKKGLAYGTLARILPEDGTRKVLEGGVLLEKVTSFYILLDTETTYEAPKPDGSTLISDDISIPIRACREKLAPLSILGEFDFNRYQEKSAHILGDFMGRARLSLSDIDYRLEKLPTSERIRRMSTGEQDTGLCLLYFDFGRYLLVSSSYNCRLPANLQGIWAETYQTPWSGDYHININLQMNYWLSEPLGMGELNKPFFAYIRFLSEHGRKTANVHYGASGWCAHHGTNPWGFTSAAFDAYWCIFPAAGAWCLTHIYEHYLFTGDASILEEYIDVFQGAASFYLDLLVEDPKTGYLVTCPSSSPENHFRGPDMGKETAYTSGSAMEIQIIRDIFTQTLTALSLIGRGDDPMVERVEHGLKKLAPIRIGKLGTIMEWHEDHEEFDSGHRHISQLYALHPAAQITFRTPELMQAAEKTLERRLSHGGGHTGWSRAWIISFYARLGLGDKCLENLNALLEKCTLPNLFDNHPPFQIDGNFGGTAGIVEMLLQSHAGRITLLPALPKAPAWQSGSIKGFRARGGITVDMCWEKGLVTSLVLHSMLTSTIEVAYNQKTEVYDLKQGESLRIC